MKPHSCLSYRLVPVMWGFAPELPPEEQYSLPSRMADVLLSLHAATPLVLVIVSVPGSWRWVSACLNLGHLHNSLQRHLGSVRLGCRKSCQQAVPVRAGAQLLRGEPWRSPLPTPSFIFRSSSENEETLVQEKGNNSAILMFMVLNILRWHMQIH